MYHESFSNDGALNNLHLVIFSYNKSISVIFPIIRRDKSDDKIMECSQYLLRLIKSSPPSNSSMLKTDIAVINESLIIAFF